MANPRLKEGIPEMFVAGNDMDTKNMVIEVLRGCGWQRIDMGSIAQWHLLEALAMFCIRYGMLNNHWTRAFKLIGK